MGGCGIKFVLRQNYCRVLWRRSSGSRKGIEKHRAYLSARRYGDSYYNHRENWMMNERIHRKGYTIRFWRKALGWIGVISSGL
jgi:hypothetical protein